MYNSVARNTLQTLSRSEIGVPKIGTKYRKRRVDPGTWEVFQLCLPSYRTDVEMKVNAEVISFMGVFELIHRCDSWAIAAEMKKIVNFETKCFRRQLHIPWAEHKGNGCPKTEDCPKQTTGAPPQNWEEETIAEVLPCDTPRPPF